MAAIGFRHHFGLKLVSIVLAGLLWLVVAGEQIVERSVRIPLEFANLPPQMEMVGDTPTLVDVRVRGSSGALSRLVAGELVAVLDLGGARPGERLFHVTGGQVQTPFGVDVVQVTPSTVSIRFEPSASKVVPIVPRVTGEPANGFVVGTVVAEPATAAVSGAASTLATLTNAITEPVSVAGASALVTEMVAVGVADSTVRLRAPQRARVTVSITPMPVEWSVSNVGVHAIPGDRRVQIAPAQVTLRVRGPRDMMTTPVETFEAMVDVKDLRPGQFVLPIRVVAPPRVGVVSVDPDRVRVRVR